jgi:hypothetical protein
LGCETLRIPHCLDNRLMDGGKFAVKFFRLENRIQDSDSKFKLENGFQVSDHKFRPDNRVKISDLKFKLENGVQFSDY